MRLLIAAILPIVLTFEAQSDDSFYPRASELFITARLPDNKPIWPLPEFKSTNWLRAHCVEATEIARHKEGDWLRILYYLRYQIDERGPGAHDFPAQVLAFLCEDRWPTPESGIVLKGLPFPFTDKTRGMFYIEHPDRNYRIVTYSLKKGT